VLDREKAAIGVVLSMEPPTRSMREEAADAGSYAGPWGQHYPRLQLLTVGDLLAGRKIDMPDTASMAANVTHRRAPSGRASTNSGVNPPWLVAYGFRSSCSERSPDVLSSRRCPPCATGTSDGCRGVAGFDAPSSMCRCGLA